MRDGKDLPPRYTGRLPNFPRRLRREMPMNSSQIRHRNFHTLFQDFIARHPDLPRRGMLKLFAQHLEEDVQRTNAQASAGPRRRG